MSIQAVRSAWRSHTPRPPHAAQEKKGVPCATVVLQPWMLRSKERGAVASFAQGLQVRSWYPRGMKAFAYKVQDAMIDFAYCPQLNAFRRAVVA